MEGTSQFVAAWREMISVSPGVRECVPPPSPFAQHTHTHIHHRRHCYCHRHPLDPASLRVVMAADANPLTFAYNLSTRRRFGGDSMVLRSARN